MKKFVIGVIVVVFIGILIYGLIKNEYFFQIFGKRNLVCEDFNLMGKMIDCSYVLIDEGMTVKVVSLNDVFLKDGKYYLSFFRYSNEDGNKVIEEKMMIGNVNNSVKTIQFKIQNDKLLYSINMVSDIPMLPQEFHNYFIKENLKGRNAIVSYTGRERDRINIILYKN